MYPTDINEMNDEIISLGGSLIPIEFNRVNEIDPSLISQLGGSYDKIKEFYDDRL